MQEEPPAANDCGMVNPYKDGNDCLSACPLGSAPSSEKICVACTDEKPYSDRASQTCVARCPPRKVPNNANDCTACEAETPFVDLVIEKTSASGTNGTNSTAVQEKQRFICTAACPASKGPDANNRCATCEGNTPFSDHTAHLCVAQCGAGHVPNAAKDCTPCDGLGLRPFADQSTLSCVEVCPPGTAPAPNTTKDCTRCESGMFVDFPYHKCVAQCAHGHAPNSTSECDKCIGETPFADPVSHK